MQNIDARNKDGQTAAEIARQDKQEEILKILIAHGAKIDTQDKPLALPAST
jgi:ankyrin repeat protein